jgi:hypothetical protein
MIAKSPEHGFARAMARKTRPGPNLAAQKNLFSIEVEKGEREREREREEAVCKTPVSLAEWQLVATGLAGRKREREEEDDDGGKKRQLGEDGVLGVGRVDAARIV